MLSDVVEVGNVFCIYVNGPFASTAGCNYNKWDISVTLVGLIADIMTSVH